MSNATSNAPGIDVEKCSAASGAMHATNATDATNERFQDQSRSSSVPEHTAGAVDNSRRLVSDDSVISPSELHMARFLAEVTFERKQSPWRFHVLSMPDDELERREYEHETERLRRFIRGQQITEGNAA